MEETTDQPWVADKHHMYRVHLAWVGFELTTLVMIGTDCIDSCKSNLHMIMTTTAPRDTEYF
jgi:hypothetical protein